MRSWLVCVFVVCVVVCICMCLCVCLCWHVYYGKLSYFRKRVHVKSIENGGMYLCVCVMHMCVVCACVLRVCVFEPFWGCQHLCVVSSSQTFQLMTTIQVWLHHHVPTLCGEVCPIWLDWSHSAIGFDHWKSTYMMSNIFNNDCSLMTFFSAWIIYFVNWIQQL